MGDTSLIVEPLTTDAFDEFGKVLQSAKAGFAPVFKQPQASGWVVGINNVSETRLLELHYHSNTWECFAPLFGRLCIVVAPSTESGFQGSSNIRAFMLTEPVAVAPGIPHCLLASPEARGSVFVCESAEVTGERVPLTEAISVTFPTA
jgi:ureidoglycolate hydrolase